MLICVMQDCINLWELLKLVTHCSYYLLDLGCNQILIGQNIKPIQLIRLFFALTGQAKATLLHFKKVITYEFITTVAKDSLWGTK